MEKEYFIRRLTEKGKLKTPSYQSGELVASWRTFTSESDAINFIKEYQIDDVIILTKIKQSRDVSYRIDQYKVNTKTPTLKEKVAQYEAFLHNINMMMFCGNPEGLQKLLAKADNWSYSHRVGNGELSDREQQKVINKAFWSLNNLL